MNDNHRKLILSNIDSLVQSTHYSIMSRECLAKQIITAVMAGNIENEGTTDNKKNDLLFRKITHRGPKAFNKLLDILKEQDFTEAHKLLANSSIPSATFRDNDVVMDADESTTYLSIQETRSLVERQISRSPTSYSKNNSFDYGTVAINTTINNDGDVVDNTQCIKSFDSELDGQSNGKPARLQLAEYDGNATFRISKLAEVRKAKEFATHPKLQVYNMKSTRRGVFFFVNIINFRDNKKRQGAEEDRENLVALFQEMRYKIFYYQDLTGWQFEQLLHDLTQSDHVKNVDSFVMCVQTHGDLSSGLTRMEFSDGSILNVENCIKKFSNIDCEALANKPKVFFFPFCRGVKSDTEQRIKRFLTSYPRDVQTDGNPGLPSFSDIL